MTLRGHLPHPKKRTPENHFLPKQKPFRLEQRKVAVIYQDLEKLEEELEKEILGKIFDLEENPLPENSYVIQLLDGTEVQCLKLQEEDRNSELNHRATYDIRQNDTVRVYGIFSRSPGYQEIKEKTKQRLGNT